MNRRIWRRLILLSSAATLLVACGGGGSGTGNEPTAAPRQPPATAVIDSFPTGARMSTGGREFVPYGSTAQWTYERRVAGSSTTSTATATSTPTGTDRSIVTGVIDGEGNDVPYRWTARGWEFDGPLPGLELTPQVAELMRHMLAYPAQFPATPEPSTQTRRGDLGVDIDGDGVNEGVQIEIVQTVHGFETVAGPAGPVQALRVRTRIAITLMPSDVARFQDQTVEVDEVEWLLEGVGPVRIESTARELQGNREQSEVMTLVSATIDGVDPFAPNTRSRLLALATEDVVADRARGVYYASVSGSDAARANRIATIDAATGDIQLSAPVGSAPGMLALAADGQSLYVALDGSGELLRLALPGMTELSRLRLPAQAFYGQMLAETLAASPTEPGTVAVALARPGVSPKHGGVVLARDGVLLPRATQEHTGSNLITFGSGGDKLFGQNNETTEFGLRRIGIVADGLVEEAVINAGGGFYTRALDRTGELLVVENRVFGADLTLRGSLAGASGCRGTGAARVICFDGTDGSSADRVVLFDTGTYTQVTAVPFTRPASGYSAIVPGVSGQVVLRQGIGHPAWRSARQLLLLGHDSLP